MTAIAPVQTGSLSRDVIRSEWIKLRSVRSSFWSLGFSVFVLFAFAIIGCLVVNNQYAHFKPADKLTFEPISFSLGGGFIAQLAVGVLGVLFITSEYSSGQIRSTFTAVPQRTRLIVSKTVVLAAIVWLVTTVAAFAAFLIGQALLSSTGINQGLGDPGAMRMIMGSGLYLMVSAILGIGIGLLIRHTGGAVAAFFGLIFVLPGLLQLVPQPTRDTLNKYAPGSSGQALFNLHPDPTILSPWVGFAVFAAWAVAVLAVAISMLNRRDV